MNIADLLAATPAAAAATPAPSKTTHPRGAFTTPADGAAHWCYEQHISHHGPPPGPGDGHNDWLTKFTKFSNERGSLLDEVLALALDTAPAGHDQAKIEATVRGIYRRDAHHHGSKPYTAHRGRGAGEYSNADSSTGDFIPAEAPPDIPAPLYERLPEFLQRACAPFEGHEKAVMLWGTLGVLSGCFPGVGGFYAGRRFWLNLFVFIAARAASGKGVMGFAAKLARPWHRRLLDENRLAEARYAEEEAAYKAAGRTGPAPVAPRKRLLFFPADSTSAALIGAMADNDGRGIIFENEADTLTTALGGEHGKFAEKLCKFFQHEPVTLIRKTDKLHIELEHPAVSLVLSGTPAQVPRLMPNAENGLVSRFVFYSFTPPLAWRSAAPTNQPPLDNYFEPLAAELTQMIAHAPRPSESSQFGAEITLSPADWQRLDTWGANGLAEAGAEAGDAGASSAVRLGPIAFRVAGLLTVLRCYENGEAPAGRLQVSPDDVTTALELVGIARKHALAVLASLPTPTSISRVASKFAAKAGQLEQVIELHGQGLSYRQIADQTGIPFSTVRNWLKNAQPN